MKDCEKSWKDLIKLRWSICRTVSEIKAKPSSHENLSVHHMSSAGMDLS